MIFFQYHPDIVNAFPSLVGGVILARNMRHSPDWGAFQAGYIQEQQSVMSRIGEMPLSQLPALAAWRTAFRQFDVDPTQYRSAAEALLRRLTKKGDIPSVNTLVDIGNMVSIRYALPVAIFDTRLIQGILTVRFADGTEEFTPLGCDETEHPQPGEVIFSDENDQVAARRWCWRQSEHSAARNDTTAAIITVEAHHPEAEEDILKALADLTCLLRQYSDADCVSAILNKDQLAAEG